MRRTTSFIPALAGLFLLPILALAQEGQSKIGPRLGEKRIECAPGWEGVVIHEAESRIAHIRAEKIFKQNATPDLLALEDQGRCTILSGGTGKWTATPTIEEFAPIGSVAVGDLDPRVPGDEIYVGTRNGNLHQIVWLKGKAFQSSPAASFPGISVTKMILADLLPERPGLELLVFLTPGDALLLEPETERPGFRTRPLLKLSGRVRDMALLPRASTAERPRVAVVIESGELALLKVGEKGLEVETIATDPMPFCRIARRPDRDSGGEVLYATRDDGLIQRFEERADGTWMRSIIYAGPHGATGIAAGRFTAALDDESVAVFAGPKVQLLTRAATGPWSVETIYTEIDNGHWLAAAELDGRNGTLELVGCGFAKRAFVLRRLPGYGLPGVAVDPDDRRPEAGAVEARASDAPRRVFGKDGSRSRTVLDFESEAAGRLPSGFHIAETAGVGHPAVWRVEAIASAPQGRNVIRLVESANTRATFNMLISDRDYPADIELAAQVRADSGVEDQGGGLVWRYRDPDNYYIARWHPLETNLRVYKVEGAKRIQLGSIDGELDGRKWHRLRVGMLGTKGTVSIDGVLRLSFEDATFGAGGRIGFWTKADAATSFDDLVIDTDFDGAPASRPTP